MQKVRCATAWFLSFFVSVSFALAQEVEPPFIIQHRQYESLDLYEARALEEIYEESIDERYNMEKVIPENMSPSDDMKEVVEKVVAHTIESFIRSPRVQQTAVVATAARVTSGLNTELDFQDGRRIRHTLKFEIKGVESTASIYYKGFTDAVLTYQIDARALQFEISERVFNGGRLLLSHLSSEEETLTMASLSWTWP